MKVVLACVALFIAVWIILLLILAMVYVLQGHLLCRIGFHQQSELMPEKCSVCGADIPDWDQTL